MKKIKILLSFTIVILGLSIFQIIHLFYSSGMIDQFLQGPKSIRDILIIVSFLFVLIVSFIANIFIIKGLRKLLIKGIFNPKSSKSFKKAGVLIILIGVISILVHLDNMADFAEVTNSYFNNFIFSEVLQKGYLIMTGIGLIIIADILKKGIALREETELTI